MSEIKIVAIHELCFFLPKETFPVHVILFGNRRVISLFLVGIYVHLIGDGKKTGVFQHLAF